MEESNREENRARKRRVSLDSANDASAKFTFEISANDERGISTRGKRERANHSYCSRVHDGEIVSCQTYGILQRLHEDVVLCPRKSRCSPNDTVCANVANSASFRFNFHSFVVLRARGSDHIFIAPTLVVFIDRLASLSLSLSVSLQTNVSTFSRDAEIPPLTTA